MASADYSALFSNLFGGSFSNLLGGTASLPSIKSTSQYLPLQDTLFNAFQNRQSIFSPSVQASGSPDAAFSSPFGQEGLNGGLRWSYDPNWMTNAPRPAASAYRAPTFAETLTGGGHRGPDVHGGPAQPPVEFDPNSGTPHVPLSVPPMPAPLNPYGHWRWQPNGGGTGIPGEWVWVDFGRGGNENGNRQL